ncbi:hypothetical protein K435DRAFT_733701 [Dendrothele bispora CBS 962.96]|uniref:DUF6535 domain-containing protein n=1 Tax=Dendrothele bispora (strain CBS 962.96) TaxID=1314807 RepID=A0A4S8L5P8_DENBC|nr:hypothetical protein K435DRAFT_733701 [Dendrothele bispora CBS 962.96]
MTSLRWLKKIIRLPPLPSPTVTDLETFTSFYTAPEDSPGPGLFEPFKPTADDEAFAKLWKVYVDQAKEYDEGLLKEWKADMEVLLIFSALFSASLTAFIIESYKTLQGDPAQNTVALLSRISQQLDGTSSFEPLMPFEPSTTSVVCNMMWFLSLTLALACSLLATFVQQWARDFIHKISLKPSPVRQARVIAFLYFGLRDFRLHTFVDVIPILLHISLFFFFGGLVAFLLPVNTALTLVMGAILLSFSMVYIVLTVLPLFYLSSPYRTPLSGVLWRFVNAFNGRLSQYHSLSSHDKTLTEAILEKSAAKTPERTERDRQALIHAIKLSTDDDELLPFIEAIPESLYDSGQNKIRRGNLKLFIPLLDSVEPDVNIWSRIAQFMSKSGYWLDNFQSRSSLACSRAVWTLVRASVDRGYIKQTNDFNLLIKSMPLLLKFVNPALSSDLFFALTILGVQWMNQIHSGQLPSDEIPQYLELTVGAFKTLSLHADTLSPISDGNLDILFKTLYNPQPSKERLEYILQSVENKEWHVIQIRILHRYLSLSQSSFTSSGVLPQKFEEICDAIYPRSKDSLDTLGSDMSRLPNTSNLLFEFKRHVDHNTFELSDTTDILMKQYLKLYFCTTKPLCSPEQSQECQRIFLWYFHELHSGDPLHNFKVHDLKHIGKCILGQIRDRPDDVEQSKMSLRVASELLCASPEGAPRVLRVTNDFFPKMFSVLHIASLSLAFKGIEKYSFFKTLLDLLICMRLRPPPRSSYQTLPQESLKQTQVELAQDYLLQQYPCLDNLDSESYRDTLAVAIVSRYIHLCCEYKVPSYCIGALWSLRPWTDWIGINVHEAIQALFARSIAELLRTVAEGHSKPEVLLLVMYNTLIFLRGSWELHWITSQASAGILVDAISQYWESVESIRIPEEYEHWKRFGELVKERFLLNRSRKVVC